MIHSNYAGLFGTVEMDLILERCSNCADFEINRSEAHDYTRVQVAPAHTDTPLLSQLVDLQSEFPDNSKTEITLFISTMLICLLNSKFGKLEK